jgi:hypothetical protein
VGSDDTHFGWRWTRKEIENYLIDPDVVSRSLGARAPDPNEYRIALERARDRIGTYQAARHALSLSRKRFSPLTNEFGRPRGSEKHLFPDAVDLVGCRSGICDTVAQHGANQLVREDEVLQRFNGLQPSFAPGGSHHGAFLWTYAGKDLLYEMRDELQALGYPSPWVFREHVVVGIEQSTEDVGAWIAEWAALRIVVDNA